MIGKVYSNKMQKCITVMVTSKVKDPKYGKSVKRRKKCKATCLDSSKFPIDSVVEIISCRPISKTIRWKVVEKD